MKICRVCANKWKNKVFRHPALYRACTRCFQQSIPEAQGVAENDAALQRFTPFLSQAAGYEELVHLADEAHHTSLYLQSELAKNPRSKKRRLQLQKKVGELETSLWFSLSDYAEEYQTLKSWLRQAFKAKTEMVEAKSPPGYFHRKEIHKSRVVIFLI